jgi:hypothetical protein
MKSSRCTKLSLERHSRISSTSLLTISVGAFSCRSRALSIILMATFVHGSVLTLARKTIPKAPFPRGCALLSISYASSNRLVPVLVELEAWLPASQLAALICTTSCSRLQHDRPGGASRGGKEQGLLGLGSPQGKPKPMGEDFGSPQSRGKVQGAPNRPPATPIYPSIANCSEGAGRSKP